MPVEAVIIVSGPLADMIGHARGGLVAKARLELKSSDLKYQGQYSGTSPVLKRSSGGTKAWYIISVSS